MAKKAAKSGNKSDAIRSALGVLGTDAKAADGWGWMEQNHPELVKGWDRKTFDSAWSNLRRKAAGKTTTPTTQTNGPVPVRSTLDLAGERLQAELAPYVKVLGRAFVVQVAKNMKD